MGVKTCMSSTLIASASFMNSILRKILFVPIFVLFCITAILDSWFFMLWKFNGKIVDLFESFTSYLENVALYLRK